MFRSRYEDRTLVECEDCGWKGEVRGCIHDYREDGSTLPDGSPTGEVEPVDLCPRCGSDQLIQISGDTAQLTLCPT